MLGKFILKKTSVLSLLGAMSIFCSTQNSLLARKWVEHIRQFSPQNIHKLVDFELLLTPKAG